MNYLFLADGFEEVEALSVVDVMRRAGIELTTVSIEDGLHVAGAHGIEVVADMNLECVDLSDADFLILPGGQPGTTNLSKCKQLTDALSAHFAQGGNVAAICAAPMIFGQLAIADGRRVTCYPGCEAPLSKAELSSDGVVVDGNIITGRGPAYAARFGLAIVEAVKGADAAEKVASAMLFRE